MRGGFSMLRRSLVVLLIGGGLGVLSVVSPAAAGNGTLGMGPTEEWAEPLSDAELSGIRGGFSGLSFSVAFTGFFDRLGNAQGNLIVNNGGATTPVPPPSVGMDGGLVNISTSIGNFNGSSGIFQIAQVPGSFNVVHNNLFVQIVLVNNGAIPSLSSLLR